MTKAKAKPAPRKPEADGGRLVVCASLPGSDAERLRAFGERERVRSGLEPRPGTLAAMLIRKGLDAVEAEA